MALRCQLWRCKSCVVVSDFEQSQLTDVSRNGVASRLSLDHKPTEETEAVRIKNEGGWIVQGKVAGISMKFRLVFTFSGMLAVTRAFGDMELKKWVTADPYITETQLKETDTILVVACDGVSRI